MKNVRKSGRAWNGAHKDSGIIVHAIDHDSPEEGFNKAICGSQPGFRGNGWVVTDKEVSCDKCINKLKKIKDAKG